MQWLSDYASRLRFPKLFVLTAIFLAIDLLVPDPLPFADEILFALVTALLGSLRHGRADSTDGPEQAQP